MSKGSTQIQETPAQVALAQHAQLEMQDYMQRWLPVQRNLATVIEQEGAPGSAQREEATGKASTDTAAQFGIAQSALESGLANRGAMPGSGRFALGLTGLGGDAAKSSGLGQMVSDQQVTDAYTHGLTSLAAIGRGESAMVGQSMESQAAASSAQAQADAEAALMERMGIGGAIGSGIGLAGQQIFGRGKDSSGLPQTPFGPGVIGG